MLLSPHSKEKKLKANAKDDERKRKEDDEEKEVALQKLPSLVLNEFGVVLPTLYPMLKSNMRMVVNNVYKLVVKWGALPSIWQS